MGLSKRSVEKAWHILNEINPSANNSAIHNLTDLNEIVLNKIMGYDKKSDGSWENVFMDLKNITPMQSEMFEKKKTDIANTFFKKDKGNGVTRIGWI